MLDLEPTRQVWESQPNRTFQPPAPRLGLSAPQHQLTRTDRLIPAETAEGGHPLVCQQLHGPVQTPQAATAEMYDWQPQADRYRYIFKTPKRMDRIEGTWRLKDA